MLPCDRILSLFPVNDRPFWNTPPLENPIFGEMKDLFAIKMTTRSIYQTCMDDYLISHHKSKKN
jgi:hypothetical protein